MIRMTRFSHLTMQEERGFRENPREQAAGTAGKGI